MMKTLTHLLLSLAAALCLFLQSATAQNIPDPNFADAIRDVCPACIDINNNLTPAAQTLKSLDVAEHEISNLTGIEGFVGLEELSCGYNPLTSLPTLPNNLKSLFCYNSQLNSITMLPNGLKLLICEGNQLKSLPDLPNSLGTLWCHNNQLKFLPVLPANLAELNCSGNQLKSLPTLPASLTSLRCYNNQLDSLPALPANLEELWCYQNKLGYLPALPANLEALWCYQNQLDSLPALPANLERLGCNNNQLNSLPTLPAGLTLLNCAYNFYLSCLPFLPNGLVILSSEATQITCIPNQPDSLYMNPVLPLCSEPCDSSVSTSNVYAAKPFSVQPNPVSEVLQVRFSADYEANADFRLFNSNGQIVRALSGKGDVEIPVGDLPEGIYWLEVRGAKWVFGEKILKK